MNDLASTGTGCDLMKLAHVARTVEPHDRVLVIDRKTVYCIDASLKDAGKKAFAIALIDDDGIIRNLFGRADELFKA